MDELVGARRRSEFFAAAAAEKLTRARLAEAARAAAGSLADADIPEWESAEQPTRGWVRSSREAVAELGPARSAAGVVSRSLLDTTALIDFSKGREPARTRILDLIAGGDELAICAVNLAEFLGRHPSWRRAGDGRLLGRAQLLGDLARRGPASGRLAP